MAKAISNTSPQNVKQTPMMRQYLEQKAQYPDCILFFRLGDFYEMFFEDAEVASSVLDIALTARSKGADSYPMCGVPYFAAKGYIAKLVDAGHKVAICDQVEDAKQAKGIVRRQVTRVVSPGMITDPDDLDARQSNYLACALSSSEAGFGCAFLDVSTGDFRVTELADESAVVDELARLRPRELLLPTDAVDSDLHAGVSERLKDLFIKFVNLTELEENPDAVSFLDSFSSSDLDKAGCAEMDAGLQAARTAFAYAAASLPGSLENIRRLVAYRVSDHLILDETSRLNLELFHTLMEGKRRGSLLHLLDHTRTPMGARMLGEWLTYPLLSPEAIKTRADAVEQLVDDAVLRLDVRDCLAGIRDLERLLGKVTAGLATPRDLGVLRDSLAGLPEWSARVARWEPGPGESRSSPLAGLIGVVDLLADLCQELDEALQDEPPADLSHGGVVRPGFDARLDELVQLATAGKEFIADMERAEREKTSIGSLKIRFNKVFGYYIEVTKANLHLVPDHYRRKQTTANAERYETDALKKIEEQILTAQDDRVAFEQRVVAGLTESVRASAGRLLAVARQVAISDVVASLAELAALHGYRRPKVDDSEQIIIKDGRHPVVEQLLKDERFVPNDVSLECDREQLLIITGPNMAGKSTTIRQVALIVILAQMGSFVPASEAHIGAVDRIFTRIGASDNLSRGQSTFMVEMIETANILHNASRRSLLILDEIGRGTSTFDGLSIAWAVAEYIHEHIQARALFATHYHQLSDLAVGMERVVNYTVSVKEWNEQIIFLRRLVRGISNRSYGIQVGQLAGLPTAVIQRAREVLANLESQEFDAVGKPALSRSSHRPLDPTPAQMTLFSPPVHSAVDEELKELDLDTLTPLEALNVLHRWKGVVK